MLKKLAPYTRGYRLYVMLGVLFSAGEAVLELELPQEARPKVMAPASSRAGRR